jgi:hypothetical protein
MAPRHLLLLLACAGLPLAGLPLAGCGDDTADPDGFTRETGALSSGDESLTSGEYSDEYTLDAQPGQWIEAAMTSTEFDPYLILRPPNCPQGGTCDQQVDNDDFIEGHGAFVWHEVEEGGRWAILATSSNPGENGAYALAYRVVPEGGTPATPGVALGSGRTERGSLEAGDPTLGSGEYTDRIGFVGRAGDRVTVDLRSDAFHPYLILQMPGQDQLDNDGWEGATDHARIEHTLPTDGMYSVLVTTFRPSESGSYELQIMPAGRGMPSGAQEAADEAGADPFAK